jgi:Zn-dependent protease
MLHLGSIGGTSLDVDFSFILLIFLFGITNYDPQRGVAYALIWAPDLFISILFHELAHAGTIGILGYGSSHVVLGGIGGVTINERHARPWQDMLISAAGPLSSFALAFICSLIFNRVAFAAQDPMLKVFLPLMVWAGFAWGLFNLLPIPPLDGGRALRNLFRMFLRENIAFVIAVWIAMLAGVAVTIWAIRSQQYFIAALIGWFTFNNFRQWQDYRSRGVPGD